MKQAKSIFVMGVTSSILILALAMMILPTHAGVPAESHNADAMWVEPGTVYFTPANATIGTKFNVTVAMNITEDVFWYSIGMSYNRTVLEATRAGYTQPPTSNYFTGHATTATGPYIDTTYLGNGSILAVETCSGSDFIPGPRSGTLIWIEFRFIGAVIQGQTLVLNISQYLSTSDTDVKDPNFDDVPFTPMDAQYPIVPEFSFLTLPILVLSFSALAVALRKIMSKKKVT